MSICLPAQTADAQEIVITFPGEPLTRIGAEQLADARIVEVTVVGTAGDGPDELVIERIEIANIGDLALQPLIVEGGADRVHGDAGSDIIEGGTGNDLQVGDTAGAE